MRSAAIPAMLGLLASPAHAGDLLIENVVVVSPERTEPLRDASVLIRDGRVASVSGPGAKKPSGTQVIDAAGLFLNRHAALKP